MTDKPTVSYYWCDYAADPALKKTLVHRQRDDGIYEIYDTVNERVIVTATQPLDKWLHDRPK